MNTIKLFLKNLILVLAAMTIVSAQQSVWLKLEKGEALVLNPVTGGWQPAMERTESPRRTFILSKENSAVKVFVATDIYTIGGNCYVFIDDVISKSRSQLVAELTRIEVEQLPNSDQRSDSLHSIGVGLTYGKQTQAAAAGGEIPFKTQRINAVNAFIDAGRNDAAVLTLKRMLARYPSLYFERPVVEQLFGLYERLELNGFLFDESTRLMALVNNEDYSRVLKEWNTTAKNRLMQTKNK
jgi:hypothetical protein